MLRTPCQLILVVCVSMALPVLADSDGESSGGDRTKCKLDYNLKGWSAFYKTHKGAGTIRCDNGETAEVTLRVKGGGLTFGKSEIVDGKGSFTPVGSIEDLMGAYGQAGAHAGATRSVEASVITKGDISLTMTGKGTGFDLGVDFGKFVIERK